MTAPAPSTSCRLRRALLAAVLSVAGVLVPVAVATPAAAAIVPGPAVFGDESQSGRIGGAGGLPRSVSCPAGSVLTAVTGTRTSHSSGGTWLSAVAATCAPITVSLTGEAGLGATATAGAIVGTNLTTFTSSTTCPAGALATGLSGRGGTLVDQVRLACSPLAAEGGLGAAVATPDAAGGAGGTAVDPADCPAGSVATGLVGAAGDDIDSVALLCRSLAFPAGTAPDETNTSWPLALDLGTSAEVTSRIRTVGQDRWFRFPVTPGSRVQVDLTGLPADYDLTLFKDIATAFTTLTTEQDLNHLSAEFAADAFAPSVFSPSVFSPSVFSPSVFSPSVFSPSVFSPSVFSPSVFSPSVFSPSVFSPSVFSPDAFAPSVFSPSVFSPSVFSPSVFSPSVFSPSVFSDAFSSAQTRSLIAVSAADGTAPESINASTWNNTGNFYVRVQGRNGAASFDPFTLRVTTTGGPCGTTLSDSGKVPPPSGLTPQAVILTDLSRMAGDTAGLRAALPVFAEAVDGVVVDLGASDRITALNAQADGLAECPYAKNLVAEAIRDVVDSHRSDDLQHVVVVGDDSVIPFFRYADNAGLGPEEGYVPPVAESSASQASLRTNHVLSQDAYGSARDISVKDGVLPVPDLAVGRLVETPAEVAATLEGFLTRGGAPLRPQSTLTTGYDFLTDAADAVATQFAQGLPNGSHDTLITDQDVPPSTTTPAGGTPSRRTSWTADDLRAALLGERHDMVFLAGHFSANSALAADYSTTMLSTEIAAAPRSTFADTLVFSAGCHSGYNIVDDEGVPGVTVGLDWTQALLQKGATLVAGTGYQYGDTDFLDYSERLYASFARELRTGTEDSVAVGTALARAKQDYLATTPTMRGIDTKSVLEATLYGLPMLGVDLPGRLTPPSPTSSIDPVAAASGTPGAALGLSSALLPVSAELTSTTKELTSTAGGTVSTSYLTGRDGVDSNPAEPVLPVLREDVTVAGQVLRGVGLRSATYADTDGITPLTGAPATESSTAHTPFASPAFFPGRLATPNYFDAVGGAGSTGRTSLSVTPAQHRSDGSGALTTTRRAYTNLGLQLYYSANRRTYDTSVGTNTPALAAPPAISSVRATAGATVDFSARVAGDPSAGIHHVWVTYTGTKGSPLHGQWQSLDLTQVMGDSTLWRGSLSLPTGQNSADVRYLVQAVNGVGLVTLDDDQGLYFTPGTTAGQDTAALVGTTLALSTAAPQQGTYGGSIPVSAVLTNVATAAQPATPLSGRRVTFALGASSRSAVTDGEGRAATDLPLSALPGALSLTASFDGEATHSSSSSAPRSVTVLKQPTTLALAPPDDAGQVVATLRGTGGVPLRDKTVLLVARDSTNTVVAVLPAATDPQGRAVVDDRRLPLAGGTLQAYFSGAVPLPPSSTLSTPTLTLVDRVYEPSTSHVVLAMIGALPGAVLGAAYDTTVAATTRPLTATGLPPGLALVAGPQGWSLQGTPTAAGAYTVVLSSGRFSVQLPLVVRYVASAFSQPVNDPGTTSASTFNVRSTVPLRFALTDVHGVRIPDAEASALVARCAVRASATDSGGTSSRVDEPIVSGTADAGTCFRYDAAADQFVFTATSGNLGFKAGRRYDVGATVTAITGDELARRTVQIGFR